MKIIIADSYYPKFLKNFYKIFPQARFKGYEVQLQELLSQSFGTSDFYSYYLNILGCNAKDLIANCTPLQAKWKGDQGLETNYFSKIIPYQSKKLEFIRKFFPNLPSIVDISIDQIKQLKPDVLYVQDLSLYSPEEMRKIRSSVKLIVGQIACPLPPDEYLASYDLILTSFPHYVPRFKDLGIKSEYFRIGFDSRILKRVGVVHRDLPVSFVGGMSKEHSAAMDTLDFLARNTPIEFFGYGSEYLHAGSVIKSRHHGEAWGLDMYKVLARSRLTINRHINVAENNANNMRLFEATGMGALLITDLKDNLGDLFEIGKEVIAYSSKEEAGELVSYYLKNTDAAQRIAIAGQERTLKDHTYEVRMRELYEILERHLRTKR